MSLWQMLIVLVVAVVGVLLVREVARGRRRRVVVKSQQAAQAVRVDRPSTEAMRSEPEAPAAQPQPATALFQPERPATSPSSTESGGDSFSNEPVVLLRASDSFVDCDEVRRVSLYARQDARQSGRYYLVVTQEEAARSAAAPPLCESTAPKPDSRTLDGFAMLKKAFDDAVSKALVDGAGAWDVATAGWKTTQSMGLGEIADKIGAIKVGVHETLMQPPAEVLSEEFALSPMTDSALKAVMEAHTLPGDGLLRELKLCVQITGMAIGVATGHLVLTNACFKSWVHDETKRVVSQGVREFFSGARPAEKQDREQAEHEASQSKFLEAVALAAPASAVLEGLGHDFDLDPDERADESDDFPYFDAQTADDRDDADEDGYGR